jgi:catechol 2,3-dioxygenase-like lactoylglutathione lyase family enzyme
MAVNVYERPRICRLARFVLTTADASRLAAFYELALGCRQLAFGHRAGAEFEELMDVKGGAASLTLCLGNDVIELLEFDHPGRPYPPESASFDLIFQHFAIVVTNMDEAFRRLSAAGGWTAISVDGPQRLPASAGGVVAFKFRDPDGHPLELLAFADNDVPPRWRTVRDSGPCLGIDHSAISVADTQCSVDFYEQMGFTVASRSLNSGVEQERLDGVCKPHVEVTAITPPRSSPHIELLCYRGVPQGRKGVLRSNDVAATRLVLETDMQEPLDTDINTQRSLVDPDGHHLSIVTPHEHRRWRRDTHTVGVPHSPGLRERMHDREMSQRYPVVDTLPARFVATRKVQLMVERKLVGCQQY